MSTSQKETELAQEIQYEEVNKSLPSFFCEREKVHIIGITNAERINTKFNDARRQLRTTYYRCDCGCEFRIKRNLKRSTKYFLLQHVCVDKTQAIRTEATTRKSHAHVLSKLTTDAIEALEPHEEQGLLSHHALTGILRKADSLCNYAWADTHDTSKGRRAKDVAKQKISTRSVTRSAIEVDQISFKALKGHKQTKTTDDLQSSSITIGEV